MRSGPRARLVPALGVVGLALLALGPVLWSRGYVVVGDMTFVPDQPWKPAWLGLDGSVPRAVPADAVISVLGTIVPGDLLQKAVLLGVLVFAGIGVLRLVGRIADVTAVGRFGAAALYVWNPYVFERLAIGHWGLLVGYAALPWVLAAALDVRRGSSGATGRLGLLLAVAAAGSPTGGLAAGLVAVAGAADRRRPGRTALVAGCALLVNLPWLAPASLNDLGTSDSSGVAAFASRSDSPLGVWGSLLTFGGIWKSAVVPGERSSMLLVAAALVLVLLSLVALVRTASAPRRLVGLAVAGLLLAGIPAVGPGERFVTDLVDAVPGAGIWRDSQKWLMPFVLVACLGFALLLDSVVRRMRRAGVPAGPATALLALAPVVLLPSLAWGLSGRYVPVDYPAEWSVVRAVLERQPAADRTTAVLPWSSYQRMPWNDRRAALDPAIRYFPGQVVVSEDLTLSDDVTVRGEDHAAARIGRAITAHEPLGPALEAAGVRYLLVERTAPSAVDVPLPPGTVLHDGPQLLLIDLGAHGRPSRSPHRALILAADGLTVLALIAGAVLLIRRKPGSRIGYDQPGSSNDGDVADYR
jgi:hypothetical protein